MAQITHSGGIGWDEILVTLFIAVAVAIAGIWADHRRQRDIHKLE